MAKRKDLIPRSLRKPPLHLRAMAWERALEVLSRTAQMMAMQCSAACKARCWLRFARATACSRPRLCLFRCCWTGRTQRLTYIGRWAAVGRLQPGRCADGASLIRFTLYSRLQKSSNLVCWKPANWIARNQQTEAALLTNQTSIRCQWPDNCASARFWG